MVGFCQNDEKVLVADCSANHFGEMPRSQVLLQFRSVVLNEFSDSLFAKLAMPEKSSSGLWSDVFDATLWHADKNYSFQGYVGLLGMVKTLFVFILFCFSFLRFLKFENTSSLFSNFLVEC